MLSLDRYATVKHPRLAQLRQRRFLPAFLAFVSWISAICISIPILIESNPIPLDNSTANINHTGQITEKDAAQTLLLISDIKSNNVQSNININSNNYALDKNSMTEYNLTRTLCLPNFGTAQMPSFFLIIYTLFVFVLPGIGVVLNHIGVHQKLCALSLTARAKFNELPLPMPILRRPTHMIVIVTGMPNAAADEEDSTNDENNQQKDERRNMMVSNRLKAIPRTPRYVNLYSSIIILFWHFIFSVCSIYNLHLYIFVLCSAYRISIVILSSYILYVYVHSSFKKHRIEIKIFMEFQFSEREYFFFNMFSFVRI